MPVVGDQDLIDSTARVARVGIFSVLGQMMFIVGMMIYRLPPTEFIRHRGAQLRAAHGAVAGKVADANDAAARAKWKTTRSAMRFVQAAVAITAVALPLSFVGPWLLIRNSRRGIVAWTWPPPSFGKGDRALPKPFTAQVLETDTGKLAYLYVVDFGIGLIIVGFAIVLAPFGYFFSGGDLIVLGAAVLLTAGAAARFPTRGRIAAWIERQQELLNHERHQMRIERQQEVLKQKRHKI